MSRRFRPMPPRPPRKSAHRKPNGPGAGVTFKDIVLARNSMPIPTRLLSANSGVERFEFPIESLLMESYYDGVESPHGFEYYASGGEKDAFAGTLDIGLSPSDLLRLVSQDGCALAVSAGSTFGGETERLFSADTETFIEVFRPYLHSVELELSIGDSYVGEGMYSAGWIRSELSEGYGPDVPVTYEVTGAIRFSIPTQVFVRELAQGGESGFEPLREMAAVAQEEGEEYFEIEMYELHGEENEDAVLCASEETATLYNTLDKTIYGVFNDDYGTFPILGTKDAEAAYAEQVASGDFEYVDLCLVDRNGDSYETVKSWRKDDADRAPNPRRPGRR